MKKGGGSKEAGESNGSLEKYTKNIPQNKTRIITLPKHTVCFVLKKTNQNI